MAALITTERLLIRPWTVSESDVAAAFAMFGDPEVTRFLTRHETSLESQRRGLEGLNERMQAFPEGMGWFALERLEDGQVAGCAVLKPLEDVGPEIEVGYHLARRHWGQGYATESALGCLRYGFGGLGLERIVAAVDPSNTASLRVLERLGMPRVEETTYKGHPCVTFAFTAGEFARLHEETS
jgi:RimJ/RimL family protein N-acetyltransferase